MLIENELTIGYINNSNEFGGFKDPSTYSTNIVLYDAARIISVNVLDNNCCVAERSIAVRLFCQNEEELLLHEGKTLADGPVCFVLIHNRTTKTTMLVNIKVIQTVNQSVYKQKES